MYKINLFLFLTLLAWPTLKAQTMRDVVRQMPAELVPLLTRNNILDFPDYIDSQMKAELTNRLSGTSEMVQLTNDYTLIRTSSSATLQLKLLPRGKKKVICSIRTYTVNDSIGDSRIQFYTTDWKLLPLLKYISLNQDEDAFVEATASASDTDLLLRWRYPLSLTFEGEKPERVAQQTTRLKWNGKKFVPAN